MTDEDGPPENPTMDGLADPEEPTPTPGRRDSPHREAVTALQNLSISLNGCSAKMAMLARTVTQTGLAAEVRATIGKDLRALRDEIDVTADVVNPGAA